MKARQKGVLSLFNPAFAHYYVCIAQLLIPQVAILRLLYIHAKMKSLSQTIGSFTLVLGNIGGISRPITIGVFRDDITFIKYPEPQNIHE